MGRELKQAHLEEVVHCSKDTLRVITVKAVCLEMGPACGLPVRIRTRGADRPLAHCGVVTHADYILFVFVCIGRGGGGGRGWSEASGARLPDANSASDTSLLVTLASHPLAVCLRLSICQRRNNNVC